MAPGCIVAQELEIDHVVPLAVGGLTALSNLARLCRRHHYLQTHLGYRLTGGPGRRSWEQPRDHAPPKVTGTLGRLLAGRVMSWIAPARPRASVPEPRSGRPRNSAP